MVSASLSAPVSMMIGALTPGATQQPADLAPVHVGQADIEQDRVEALLARELERACAAIGFAALELLEQAKLLGQRLAQRLVVIDQHQPPPAGRTIHHRRHG